MVDPRNYPQIPCCTKADSGGTATEFCESICCRDARHSFRYVFMPPTGTRSKLDSNTQEQETQRERVRNFILGVHYALVDDASDGGQVQTYVKGLRLSYGVERHLCVDTSLTKIGSFASTVTRAKKLSRGETQPHPALQKQCLGNVRR